MKQRGQTAEFPVIFDRDVIDVVIGIAERHAERTEGRQVIAQALAVGAVAIQADAAAASKVGGRQAIQKVAPDRAAAVLDNKTVAAQYGGDRRPEGQRGFGQHRDIVGGHALQAEGELAEAALQVDFVDDDADVVAIGVVAQGVLGGPEKPPGAGFKPEFKARVQAAVHQVRVAGQHEPAARDVVGSLHHIAAGAV